MKLPTLTHKKGFSILENRVMYLIWLMNGFAFSNNKRIKGILKSEMHDSIRLKKFIRVDSVYSDLVRELYGKNY